MSRTMRAGGFTPLGAVAGDLLEWFQCARCGSGLDLAWVHVQSFSVVCSRCMADPDVDGAGQRVAELLTTRREKPVFLADVDVADEDLAEHGVR